MLPNDNELLGKYLYSDDDTAFEELIRRHSGMVLSVCKNMLFDQHDAEDAFQATFLILSRKASGLLDRGSIAGWLYHVAVRNCLQIRRRRGRGRETEMNQDPVISNEEPWLAISHAQESDLIHKEIQRLPERYREVIVLTHLQGYSRRQVAEFLGWTESAVKAALGRARNLLRRRLVRRGIVTTTLLVMLQSTSAMASQTMNESLISATLKICGGAASTAGVGTGTATVQSLASQGATGMSPILKVIAISAALITAITIPLTIFAQNNDLGQTNERHVAIDLEELNSGSAAHDVGVPVSTSTVKLDAPSLNGAVPGLTEKSNSANGAQTLTSSAPTQANDLDPYSTLDSIEYWRLMMEAYELKIQALKLKGRRIENSEQESDRALAQAEIVEMRAKIIEASLHIKRIKAGVSATQGKPANASVSNRKNSNTVSKPNQTPVPPASTAVVKAGEELVIEFLGIPDLAPRLVVVQADLTIEIPFVGTFSVKDKTTRQIKEALDNKLAEFAKDPMTFVSRSVSSSPLRSNGN